MKRAILEGRYTEINGEWYVLDGDRLVPADSSPELRADKKSPTRYSVQDGVELSQSEFEELLDVGMLLETNEKGKFLYVSEVKGEVGILWLSEIFGGDERIVLVNIDNLTDIKYNCGNEGLLKTIKILYGVNYIKDNFWHNEVIEFRGKWWKLAYRFNAESIYTSVKELEMQENIKVKNKYVKDIEL